MTILVSCETRKFMFNNLILFIMLEQKIFFTRVYVVMKYDNITHVNSSLIYFVSREDAKEYCRRFKFLRNCYLSVKSLRVFLDIDSFFDFISNEDLY